MTAEGGVFTVREAVEADAAVIVDLGRRTWVDTHAGVIDDEIAPLMLDKWWTVEATVPSIRAGRTLVAVRGDEIVGMAAYGPYGEGQVVWKLYVAPECQRSGAGRLLMEAVFDRVEPLREDVSIAFHDGVRRVGSFLAGLGFVVDHRETQSGLPDLVWMRRPHEGERP